MEKKEILPLSMRYDEISGILERFKVRCARSSGGTSSSSNLKSFGTMRIGHIAM
jgi:hypothetical protein